MARNQKGLAHLLLLVVLIVVVAVIGFMGWKLAHREQDKLNVQAGNGPNYSALPNCSGDAVLDTLPTTLGDYDQIIPLGNINVPDHTQPADHMYFAFKHIGGTTTNPDLFAPGKIVVINITNSGEKKNGTQISNDYAIMFTPCKGLVFKFGHVETLTGQVAEAVKGENWDKPCEQHNQAAGEETFYCSKDTDLLLQSGQKIGKVGGSPQIGAFDLGANKSGYKDPGILDVNYNQEPTAVCPLDYFSPAIKAKLYDLVKRTAEPRCGVIGQDKANTAQGGWYATTDKRMAQQLWNSQLALVHDNLDPSVGMLAVGGTISQPAKVSFKPARAGLVNREPSETTSGTVYCYQDEGLLQSNSNPSTGKYLVELVDNLTLRVEHQEGTCTSSERMSHPTTYYR